MPSKQLLRGVDLLSRQAIFASVSSRILIGLVLTRLACGSSERPCMALGNGGRDLYHSPYANESWKQDCDNPLKREYWRVFEQGDTAYTIPRVDTTPDDVRALCAEADLEPTLARYGLCPDPKSSSPSAVNAMQTADAVRIARALHQRLRFAVNENVGVGITPFPMPTDVVDACALRLETPAEFKQVCDFWRERIIDRHEVGLSYRGAAASEVAARLNELYGVAAK